MAADQSTTGRFDAWISRASLWLLAYVLGGVVVFVGARAGARWLLGPPGLRYVVADAGGALVAEGRAAYAIAPEAIPSPPVGGKLVLTGTFFADVDGTYVWNLGGSSPARLTVDGQLLFEPPRGLVRGQEQRLRAGPHAVMVELLRADREGAVAFAMRRPGEPWRARLIGPDDATSLGAAEVAQRTRGHFGLVRALVRAAPYLALLLVAAVVVAFARPRRVRAAVRACLADPSAQRLGVALLLVAIVLPMIAPLFEPGFYFCHEGEGYTVRLVQYQAAVRAGVPMGRWWPDPVFGRGYPFLCLYAPLLYLISTPLLLADVDAMTVVKLITGGVVVIGAWATYALARRRASRPAALLAAALFTYAPYVHTNVWVRADLAECLGFPTFLLSLLALERVLDGSERERAWSDVAWLALAVAALGCSHNITAYFSVYFIGLWLALRWALRTTDRDAVMRAVAGGGLGFLMTVFYALPALQDSGRVWVTRLTTGYYDPSRNLMQWWMVLWNEPRWGMRTSVGIAQSLAAAAGIAALFAWRARVAAFVPLARGLRVQTIAAAAGLLMAVAFASRPIGLWLVRYAPLAKFVGFPWRLFLFAACLAPLCAPAAVDVLRSPRLRWGVSSLAIVVMMAVLLPIYGPSAPLVRVHVQARVFLRELETDYVTSMNEYLPRTVQRTVPRFDDVAHVVRGSATLSGATREPGRYAVDVQATTRAVVELNAHWFPGWRAEVDGRPVRIGPGGDAPFDDGGLLRVAVPAGAHHVAARFGRTPLRAACDAISGATLLFVLFLLGRAALRRRARPA